jgi:hypothetical protein
VIQQQTAMGNAIRVISGCYYTYAGRGRTVSFRLAPNWCLPGGNARPKWCPYEKQPCQQTEYTEIRSSNDRDPRRRTAETRCWSACRHTDLPNLDVYFFFDGGDEAVG